MAVVGVETIAQPLTESGLSKKGLCDYVVNVASGCLHGCKFCYVPSTPMIRMRQAHLKERGVDDPQMDWGSYLFIRDDLPEALERSLSSNRKWKQSEAGKGVVMLCSGTDPYQNSRVARVTRQAVQVLLKHNKRVRILTRSPLWLRDLDILVHPNVTVGMSIPHLDDELSRQIEPGAPRPSDRLKAMKLGHEAGCRLYVAMAPTPPMLEVAHFINILWQFEEFKPEVIFWEPINGRGTNGKRMLAAGLDWAKEIQSTDQWANNFLRQWMHVVCAAEVVHCFDRLHVWADKGLTPFCEENVEEWFYKPTPEQWSS